ncbi:hypothetical protein RA876_19730 (plasmid) [Rhodoferax antarcticus]|nr:hypothetical protein RA876_19300 [Rhodoferax antarcticus]APW48707.1 hypothetical protein RA876_19730 [Rhodoferax antarcticus]
MRRLDVTEYIRRAALGRKAEVDYEAVTMTSLMEVTNSIRELYSALVERGIPPMKDDIRPIVDHAIAAMLRISK